MFRPFCSERCQLVDLSGWLGQRYRVPDDSLEDQADSSSLKDES
ncbi:MAG: DNA gyrase inhibitor YacG [Nitrospirales bacterium]|nr:DNA gyrase inhibitor YacG [Nitrospirales bacterium]